FVASRDAGSRITAVRFSFLLPLHDSAAEECTTFGPPVDCVWLATNNRFRSTGQPGSRIINISTKTGGFAADLLQVQPSATIGSIHDCRIEHTSGAARRLLAGEGKALTRNAADL